MFIVLLPRSQGLKIDVSERDLDGISVLDTASSVGDLIVTRVLCIRGLADPGESAPDGWSPLMKVQRRA
jgi:ankyrin repeat protein